MNKNELLKINLMQFSVYSAYLLLSAYMFGRVSGLTSKRERRFHGEFIHEKSIFTCKPWFKRLAGISTTSSLYPQIFMVYVALDCIHIQKPIYYEHKQNQDQIRRN